MAQRLAERPALGFELLAGLAILFPGIREGRQADLLEPGFAVHDERADDGPWGRNPLLAVDRIRLAEIVIAALALADTVGDIRHVDQAFRVDLRMIVEQHEDVGTGA